MEVNRKEVLMKMTDSHYDGENTECSEITSVAFYEGTDNDYTITYKESGDFEGCEASLKVVGKKAVTLTRAGGGYNVQLIIEQGQRHNCIYNTPFGAIQLGVFAEKVFTDIREGEGELKLSYSIDFNTGFVSENDITVTIKNI